MKEMPTQLDPQSLNEVLRGRGLERIMRKAQELIALNRLLADILPSDIAKHCSVMNYKEDTLVLQVNNAAIGTRIRYESSQILNSLHFYDKYRNIKKIACKVCPKN